MAGLTELLNQWYPTILAFAVVAGSINGMMEALKATVKNMEFRDKPWFVRLMPLLPNLMGAAAWPFVGPYVYPEGIQSIWVLDIIAGGLAGSLSANIYAIWVGSVKRADARVMDAIDHAGRPEGAGAEDKPAELAASPGLDPEVEALAAEILDDSEPEDEEPVDDPELEDDELEDPSADDVDGERLPNPTDDA